MKYLGVDFGIRRIGLAISEGNIASPFRIIITKNLTDSLNQIKKIVQEVEAEKIIIGLPEGAMGQVVKKFIKSLEKTGLEVCSVDETLSSKRADLKMIEDGVSKKKRRQNDDVAAAIILQQFLDEKN